MTFNMFDLGKKMLEYIGGLFGQLHTTTDLCNNLDDLDNHSESFATCYEEKKKFFSSEELCFGEPVEPGETPFFRFERKPVPEKYLGISFDDLPPHLADLKRIPDEDFKHAEYQYHIWGTATYYPLTLEALHKYCGVALRDYVEKFESLYDKVLPEIFSQVADEMMKATEVPKRGKLRDWEVVCVSALSYCPGVTQEIFDVYRQLEHVPLFLQSGQGIKMPTCSYNVPNFPDCPEKTLFMPEAGPEREKFFTKLEKRSSDKTKLYRKPENLNYD